MDEALKQKIENAANKLHISVSDFIRMVMSEKADDVIGKND